MKNEIKVWHYKLGGKHALRDIWFELLWHNIGAHYDCQLSIGMAT